jgi:cyclase
MSDGNLIKTRAFVDPKYVGDPINAVKIFNEKEVDELVILDIHAWRSGHPDFALLEKIAVESRMPLCYGGGITSAEQAAEVVRIGFEKISVSSRAIAAPALVSDMAEAIGSQSVVVTFDIRRDSGGDYQLFVENGQRHVPGLLEQHLEAAVLAGAGELVINIIDREGACSGYDIALAQRLLQRFPLPMTMFGGAGNVGHMAELIEAVGVVGAGAGTMFVFRGAFRAVLISYARPEILR